MPVVVRQLDEAGIGVTDIAARQATLDDVFFALTGHGAEEGGRGRRTERATSHW